MVYQNILKLAYVDKLLDQVNLVFRDRYKNEVAGKAYGHHFDFTQEFEVMALSAGPVPREVIIVATFSPVASWKLLCIN